MFQLTDLTQENLLLKGKEVTLVETLSNIQVESKANRETIMRLVSEMEREQKATSKFSTEIETLRVVSAVAEILVTKLSSCVHEEGYACL